MGNTEKTLRSYPKQVRVLARRYDSLLRKLTADFNDSDYTRLGHIGNELAMRAMWGNR
jgi:hypothetical protein